jgi:glycosyltransferase involved in cell wall biosynthesis
LLGIDPYSYAKRACRIIEKVHPDILHFHNAHNLIPDVLSHLSYKPAVISHFHNDFHIIDSKGVDLILTCSEFLSSVYREKLQNNNINIQSVCNGVDTEIFNPSLKDGPMSLSLRSELGIPLDGKVVLFAGRIAHEKGPHILIEAFEKLISKMSDIYLVLVGEIRTAGRQNDKRFLYGKDILNRCKKIGSNVKIIGAVSPEKMPYYYSIGDIAVVPSVFEEPFGMVAIEAMASGLPVIASKKGGMKEYITDNSNGIFISDNNPSEDIMNKIRLIMLDKELRERLGRAGRKSLEDRFSWGRIAFETEKIYSSLLNN